MVIGVQVCANFRRQYFFAIEGASGRHADQEKGDRDQDQQRGYQTQQTQGGVMQNSALPHCCSPADCASRDFSLNMLRVG